MTSRCLVDKMKTRCPKRSSSRTVRRRQNFIGSKLFWPRRPGGLWQPEVGGGAKELHGQDSVCIQPPLHWCLLTALLGAELTGRGKGTIMRRDSIAKRWLGAGGSCSCMPRTAVGSRWGASGAVQPRSLHHVSSRPAWRASLRRRWIPAGETAQHALLFLSD